MPRQKRSIKQIESDSEEEYVHDAEPPTKRKRSSRIAQKAKIQEEDEEEKNANGLCVTRVESIAIIAPNRDQIKGSKKIAAFDMDWTLIKPKGKNKFPKGRNDWVWMYKNVPSKLQQLHKDGYQIVIFSNQNGIGSGKQSLDSVSGKIIDLSTELKVPLFGYLSIEKDHWRKPTTAMWDHFAAKYNNNVSIDYASSYYVGDAAGRPKAWKNKDTKKDFSCSDRKFAANVGIAFHTPDAYFLGEAENTTWKWLSLNPKQWLEQKEHDPDKLKDTKNWFHGKLPIAKQADDGVDMVLMRGPPGCGKSTFAKKYLVSKGYVYVNRDTLKTKKKCLDAAKKALKEGKCVVIDNTNPDADAREPYIKIGQQCKANIRLFNMKVEREVAEHMNLVREKLTKGGVARISGMVYNIFYKKCREDGEPTLDEGINEIVNIDFIPDFKDDDTKKIWMQFT